MGLLLPQVKIKFHYSTGAPPILAPAYLCRVISYDSLFLTLNYSQAEHLCLPLMCGALSCLCDFVHTDVS